MDNTIINSIIAGAILLITNISTGIITSKQIKKREEKKYYSDLQIKIAEYAVENPEKLLQIEKKLAIGILMIEDPNTRIRKYIIPNNRIQIGRYITSDIILTCQYISNEHCAIYSNANEVYIEDLLSTNGTKVNGKAIQSSVKLLDGDLIQIGTLTIMKYKKLNR